MAKTSSIVLAGALLLLPTAAFAQPEAPTEGFGERDSFVLSIERSFGFVSQTIGEDDYDQTVETQGFFTPFWGDVGLFSVSDSISWGTLLGFSQLSMDDDPNDESLYLLRVKPRVGFTFAKDELLAAWLRVGPSLLLVHSSDDDDDYTSYYTAVSGEAYMVITPVEHMGILAGPVIDINVFSRDDDDNDVSYKSFGLAAGMFGEF